MIKNYNPTSAGIRFRKSIVKDSTANNPEKSLLRPHKGSAGRSNGRISSRGKLQGAKRHYRLVDFKREKFNIVATVATIEHDPNRGPNIALLKYTDGEKRYILAPEGLKIGAKVVSGLGSDIEAALGNCLPLANIPLATFVHNVELNPGQGGILARGAGNAAQIIASEGDYVNIKLPSGQVKKVLAKCLATIGVLGNQDLRNTNLGKAGKKRHLGWRPKVRGVAMANPSDHPHAGSYRDNGIGMPFPKTPWGKNTRGVKTRTRVHTDWSIVSN